MELLACTTVTSKLTGGAAVDHLELFVVNQHASSHGTVALVVVLAGRKHGKDPSTLRNSNAVRVRLVCAHDVGEVLLLQKVRHKLHHLWNKKMHCQNKRK
jgi:hypothetical protein